MTLALKPIHLDYSIDLLHSSLHSSLHITALHNQHPVATDDFPWPFTSRQPRPAE